MPAWFLLALMNRGQRNWLLCDDVYTVFFHPFFKPPPLFVKPMVYLILSDTVPADTPDSALLCCREQHASGFPTGLPSCPFLPVVECKLRRAGVRPGQARFSGSRNCGLRNLVSPIVFIYLLRFEGVHIEEGLSRPTVMGAGALSVVHLQSFSEDISNTSFRSESV